MFFPADLTPNPPKTMKQKLTIEVDVPEGYELTGGLDVEHRLVRKFDTVVSVAYMGHAELRRTHKTLKASQAPGLKPGVWIAKTQYGEWWAFSTKPSKFDGYWRSPGNQLKHLYEDVFGPFPECSWEDSLHQITE